MLPTRAAGPNVSSNVLLSLPEGRARGFGSKESLRETGKRVSCSNSCVARKVFPKSPIPFPLNFEFPSEQQPVKGVFFLSVFLGQPELKRNGALVLWALTGCLPSCSGMSSLGLYSLWDALSVASPSGFYFNHSPVHPLQRLEVWPSARLFYSLRLAETW